IALLAAGIEAGDEVIVPPYTFIATAESVIEANAVPIFVDIDPATFNIDPAKIEEAITPRTRAIMPVHLGGVMCDMDAIMAIADRHGLTVIEDAAHAHGARHTRGAAGSIGHMGSFSFQSSKNLNCGEGGIILTSDEKLYSACCQIHNCGRVPEGEWYEHASIGANYRLSEFEAAILNAQFERLDDQSNLRDANARYLAGLLEGMPGIQAQATPQYVVRHGCHLFSMRYDEDAWGLPRDAWCRAVSAEGVGISAAYTEPLYRQPMFTEKRFGPYTGYRSSNPDIDFAACAERCPATERICNHEGLWLYQSIFLGTQEDMDDIAEAIAKVHRHRDTVREHARKWAEETGS
ncbi:hypothetical protein LCGC14_2628720, partial [marine sediment metagenome]